MNKNKNLIEALQNGDITKDNTPQKGQIELVDEVNAGQTHKSLVDAVKAPLESGANTSYNESKKLDFNNVAQNFVMGDLHGLPARSESQRKSVLHELGHIAANNIAKNRDRLKTIDETTGLTLEEALKGPKGQGNTEAYKAAAKEMVNLLELTFVKPATLREKFNSTDKKDKNTPK